MTTVYCQRTGWPTDRRLRRGYQLEQDSCEICGADLTRKAPHMDVAGPGECPSHECCGDRVKGQALGVVARRVWLGTTVIPGTPVSHYADMAGFRCPRCGAEWEETGNRWTEHEPGSTRRAEATGNRQ